MYTAIDCFCEPGKSAVPLLPLSPEQFSDWLDQASPREAQWVRANNFKAQDGQLCTIPDPEGAITRVLVAAGMEPDPDVLGALAGQLAPGDYVLDCDWDEARRISALTGFALGAYRFSRYQKTLSASAKLQLPGSCAAAAALRARVEAIYLARDLINTPTEDLPPQALGEAAQALAGRHGGTCTQVVGEDLLARNYPAIHAVGRASVNAPRLIDLRWGDPGAPRLNLIGKGVCFDSGGLDLKPAAGMRLMKKDMGGAAHALCLASMIMSLELPVRLRVLIPAVENAVSANALRPGDIIASRQGLSIEIDNTDAEGRLVLADALTEACSEDPDLVLDFATLTGAARTAVGTDIAALFCNDDELAEGLEQAAREQQDPIWRMPLHRPYRKLIESKIADLANSAPVPYAGAITAALFLEHFVTPGTPWAHFDVMAWNTRTRPGHPEGGEVLGVRAVFDYLSRRYT